MAMSFDYVVVGGGSAGCVLAARLSEEQGVRVALLEAGSADSNPALWNTDVRRLPRLWTGSAPENWGYRTVPQTGLRGRAVDIARGKVLGGSSAVNAMLYVRGNRRDFDDWRNQGNDGWSYAQVLPYFMRSERFHGSSSAYHGRNGPMSVIDCRAAAPVSHAFVEAAASLGGGRRYVDFNGAAQEAGPGLYQSTRTPDGRRVSAASAFLGPNRARENLTVRVDSRATRILMRGSRAVGVECAGSRGVEQLTASREVIVCCGAFESPKLLMLSGLGPAAELRRHGIRTVVDLPGVGRELQDHLMFGVAYACKMHLDTPELLAEAGVFVRSPSSHAAAPPDLQYFFGPLEFVAEEYASGGPAFTFAPILLRPLSRGTVRLASPNPRDLACVDPAYLSREDDVAVLEYAIRYARELANLPVFDAFRGAELAPGPRCKTSSELREYVRRVATTVWHPAGTCQMGFGAGAVVDPELRVHGVQSLRVADASVMPRLVSGNPNAAVVMIAEKAADAILGRPREMSSGVAFDEVADQ